jgi:beta-N-acetylhexosaminidase
MRFALFTCLLFVSFTVSAQKNPDFLTNHQAKWVENTLKNMSLDEKIGQILMPRGNFGGKGYDPQKLAKWVKEYKIGGLVFFGGQPTIQAQITNQLQAISKIPLFIGEDFEWGLAMRLDSTVRFPYQMALGAMPQNEELVEKMGQEIGRQCNRLGVNVNYAPVVDVNNNPNNPVINFRAFGEDKINVTKKALAYMRGLQSQRIITSAKHFPGHGDTGVDSHYDLPIILHDKKRLNDIELYPYKELMNNGLSGVMTAHLSIPSLDTTKNMASTLSPKIVTDLLRKELGFKGLVFTDAMDMQALVKFFPKGEAIVRAVLAGNDIIETFEDVPTGFNALKEAVAKGRITENDLNIRVKKILMAKSWAGLDKFQPIKIENLVQDLNTVQADLLNRQLAEASITLLKNENDALPIKDLTQKIAFVAIDAKEMTAFQKMANNYTKIDHFFVPQNAPDSLIQKISAQTSLYDLVVVSLHLSNIRPSAKYSLNESNQKAVTALTKSGKSVLAIFGNAFSLDKLQGISATKAIVLGYQMTNYAEEAAAQAIFGATAMQGRLPMTINSTYKMGMGVSSAPIGRLAYGIPEMVGIDGKALNMRIDSLVNLGLREKAYPGAVVQVAKDGKVIFQKNYGFHTYEQASNSLQNDPKNSFQTGTKNDVMDEKVQKSSVTNAQKQTTTIAGAVQLTDLYDLASITKIATSALAVMQLTGEGKFDINKKYADYVPEFTNSNKANLTFKDMLTHKAGLKAWIPFWTDCIDSVKTVQNSLVFKEKYEKNFHQNFFQRLFFGKKRMEKKLALAIQTDKNIWKDCYDAKSITWLPNIFAKTQSPEYPVQVADALWVSKNYQNTLLQSIQKSPIKPEQGYVYSDLHYYTYPKIVSQITGMDWETYLNKTYKNIGANTLTYNPLRFFPKEKIVPTERDDFFRKTLIHGRVHDEGAALLNGISGHAGLFGNANDLMKLMQLYLQKGNYGSTQYIQPEIVSNFTNYQFPELKNRRGIAFDKPSFDKHTNNAPPSASEMSFGHSGFTGTFTWADPKYNLVYVFLSNRVYPTRENGKISALNIRTEVGEAIYRSMK